MNKYEIEVTETTKISYVVEANSKEEAKELFARWVDLHQEWVSDDLLDGFCGWEYSEPEEINGDQFVDLNYKELLSDGQ